MTPFDIVLVPFPFSDLTSSKRRPCLILSSFRPRAMGEHLVVAMVTSQISVPHFPFDVIVSDLSPTGLPKPSLVRLSKVVTIDSQLVAKRLGVLAKKDQLQVRREFRKLFEALG